MRLPWERVPYVVERLPVAASSSDVLHDAMHEDSGTRKMTREPALAPAGTMSSSPAGVTILLSGGTKTSRLPEESLVCTACTQRDEVFGFFRLATVVGRASTLLEHAVSHI